jgi:hypothetical protein
MENQNLPIPQQDEIKLSDYVRIALQYRYLIVLVFVIVMILTIVYTARQPKVYAASSRILLENQATGADMLFMTTTGSGKKHSEQPDRDDEKPSHPYSGLGDHEKVSRLGILSGNQFGKPGCKIGCSASRIKT